MNRIERLKSVWQVEGKEVASLCDQLNAEQANQVLDALLNAKNNGNRVFVSGVGTSGAAAKKIAHSFCCVELPSAFLAPGDACHGGLGTVQKNDVVILISKGGGTLEIVNMIDSLKKKEAVIIGVTENPNSVLGKNSIIQVNIKIEKEPDLFNMLATASTMKVIAFFDAIAIAYMEESNYSREQFSVIHPGGAVGSRLLSNNL